MATIQRWERSIRKYVPHKVPDDWDIRTYSYNMDEVINCVCCGKKMKYGNGYTSKRFHTPLGFGFMECRECYEAYIQEERR